MRQWCLAVGIWVGLFSVASGQDRPLLTNQQQGYQGVTPGSGNPPPRARVSRRERRTVVTWPGFQAGEQGSRIFIQTSRPITVQESRGPSRLIYRLPDAVISTRNNRNPLVTTQFNTPVRLAFLRRKGRDVELVIELRAEAQPNVSTRSGQDGFSFVFIEFPGGNWIPDGPPAIAEPRQRLSRSRSLSSSRQQQDEEEPMLSDDGSSIGPTP